VQHPIQFGNRFPSNWQDDNRYAADELIPTTIANRIVFRLVEDTPLTPNASFAQRLPSGGVASPFQAEPRHNKAMGK
jgi:hypothetical protein